MSGSVLFDLLKCRYTKNSKQRLQKPSQSNCCYSALSSFETSLGWDLGCFEVYRAGKSSTHHNEVCLTRKKMLEQQTLVKVTVLEGNALLVQLH